MIVGTSVQPENPESSTQRVCVWVSERVSVSRSLSLAVNLHSSEDGATAYLFLVSRSV